MMQFIGSGGNRSCQVALEVASVFFVIFSKTFTVVLSSQITLYGLKYP